MIIVSWARAWKVSPADLSHLHMLQQNTTEGTWLSKHAMIIWAWNCWSLCRSISSRALVSLYGTWWFFKSMRANSAGRALLQILACVWNNILINSHNAGKHIRRRAKIVCDDLTFSYCFTNENTFEMDKLAKNAQMSTQRVVATLKI